MRFQNQDEAKIWDQFKQGDLEAFSYVYETYFDSLFFYTLKIVGNEEEAKDCLCEFFLYLWEHRTQLSQLNTLKFYLIKSCRRFSIRYLKKSKINLISDNDSGAEEVAITFSPEEIITQQETIYLRKKQIAKLINSLSNRQKEIILLRYFESLSIREIAVILQINEQSVVNHLQRIFQKLKTKKSTLIT